jgi:signal transduction histidine kinase
VRDARERHRGRPAGQAAGDSWDDLFRRLAETAPAGLLLLQPDGTTSFRNAEAERMLGAGGGPIDRLLSEAIADSERAGMAQAVTLGGGPLQIEVECRVLAAPWLAPLRVIWLTDVTRPKLLQRRLNAIAQVSSTVADVGNLPATLDAVAREVVGASEIAATQIMILDETGTGLRLLGAAGFADITDFAALLRECQRRGAELKMLAAAAAGRPVVVPHRRHDVLMDARWEPLHGIMGQPDWDGFASIPLTVSGRTVGVLNAFYATGCEPTTEALGFLTSMAEQAAIAVDHAALASAAEVQARQQERHRLAAELHDSVVQQVFSIKMQAEALRLRAEGGKPMTAARIAGHASELAAASRRALDDLRTLVFEMRPIELADQGLVAAASALVDSIRSRTGLNASFHSDLGMVALPADLEDDAYRILQELLHNVVKHARASLVMVRMSVHGSAADRLVIEITDDGAGFAESAKTGPSLGMVSIRERAQRWGGSVVLRGIPAGGGQARITIPLPAVPLPARPACAGNRDE